MTVYHYWPKLRANIMTASTQPHIRSVVMTVDHYWPKLRANIIIASTQPHIRSVVMTVDHYWPKLRANIIIASTQPHIRSVVMTDMNLRMKAGCCTNLFVCAVHAESSICHLHEQTFPMKPLSILLIVCIFIVATANSVVGATSALRADDMTYLTSSSRPAHG